MKMFSFLKSQKSIFGLIFILVVPLNIANTETSYAFPHGFMMPISGVEFIANDNVDIHDAEREEFWIAQMSWPVSRVLFSSGFGHRTSPCSSCSSDHKGLDFVPGAGSPVFASMSGTIVSAGYDGSYGLSILIQHDNGWQTRYAHLKNGSIPENIFSGAIVLQGETIGSVGNTGTSTGAHLHFEILIDGIQVDPMPILKKLT